MARRADSYRRPAAPPAEDRVEARLIAIAAEHIRRFGPDKVTVVAVAREAGMSHANVYRFFPSKAGLVEAVVVAWARSVELTLGDIANAPDPADDKLERFLTAWAKAQRDGLDRDSAIYGAYASFWEGRRDSIMAHRARLRAFLAAIVDEGLEPGPFRIRDEEKAVAFVADAMQRFIHPALVMETRDLTRAQVEARAALMARVVVRALVAGAV
ncbi:TetR/AcrR family transcriptional regulator [Phreatobacter sp. AB_2022a]|uniref:TetR/AcrR family transcriptional regulator n=1 Tax=Phreatobacter sp. AB_2022a TaxID=3003134 RepID=UPI002286CFA1|nr:TetR/AcrR family transcriptional regulator [Phreatobacter sp. AB_2022a]MCZ0733386.1 TetR/AcrR family transcriptional regulator [Phreatobacter sp. AB_2022a]